MTQPPPLLLRQQLPELARFGEAWVLDGQYRGLSPRTLDNRRSLIRKLVWWAERNTPDGVGTPELKLFLHYVAEGEPGGRWGLEGETEKNAPGTVFSLYSRLRTFYRFLVNEGYLTESPLAKVKPPVYRADQVQPFTPDQVRALLAAAKRSDLPERNEALFLILLDTGLRASELCALRRRDLDVPGLRAYVLGKGNKHRAVFFSRTTARALNRYFRWLESPPKSSRCTPVATTPDMSVFLSEREDGLGEKVPLSRSGLQQVIRRLGKAAGIEAMRCSPHVFRHTAAVMFLRAGGHVFALKEMLGHTTLVMTNRYAMIAQADVRQQHAQFSPVESLKKGGG